MDGPFLHSLRHADQDQNQDRIWRVVLGLLQVEHVVVCDRCDVCCGGVMAGRCARRLLGTAVWGGTEVRQRR